MFRLVNYTRVSSARNMFSLPKIPYITSWYQSRSVGASAAADGAVVDLPPVPVHHIETATEKPARTLKHLIRLNHINNAVYFNNNLFHNHVVHVSGLVAFFFDLIWACGC